MPASATNDADLLGLFVSTGKDEPFAELMRRHGPLVLAVCRRVLGNLADADDAAQAVFITLARKAPTMSPKTNIPGWLHLTATNIARRTRQMRGTRRFHEHKSGEEPSGAGVPSESALTLLDESLNALPDAYRVPLVLFHLQGRSHDEIAAQLGIASGTVAWRLNHGREKLRGRLQRHGLALSIATLTATLAQAQAAQATIPAAMVGQIAQAASAVAHGAPVQSLVSQGVLTMSNYGLKTVALAKMAVASSIAAMALLGGGAVWMSTASSAEKPAPMPAWRKGLPAMKPFAIPGTSVDECKVFWVGQLNYSGAAAIDSDKQAMWFSVAAGGHAINNLNAVFKIDFMQDHPKWSQDCAPSSPEVQAAAGDAKYHSDGRPGSGHTYYSEWGFPTKDLAVRVRLTATHPGAINHWNSDAYSITKKDWVLPGGTAFPPGIPGFGAEVNMVGCEAQDPRNYDLYHHNGANVVRFSTEKWAWENFGSPAPGDQLWSYAPALIDTKLDRFVCIFGTRDANPATFAFQDLKSKAFGKITIVPDKQHGAPYLYEYNGACYDPDNNVYWYVGPDPAKIQSEAIVWTIDPTTGQATYMANVPGASSGPCNRFTYFRALKGIVYMPAGPELVFFPTK